MVKSKKQKETEEFAGTLMRLPTVVVLDFLYDKMKEGKKNKAQINIPFKDCKFSLICEAKE